MQSELREVLMTAARAPLLLAASDFDGTIARIVEDPAAARPDPDALAALRALGQTPWTRTAVISGRSFGDLRRFLGSSGREILVGSHGAEWGGPSVELDAAERDCLERIEGTLRGIAESNRGVVHELKPAGAALHVRRVPPETGARIIAAVIEQLADLPGVRVMHGSMVVEFMVRPASKADALRRAKHVTGAGAVVFIGDDRTDEEAFAALTGDDVGVKVGEGETAARYRVTGVGDVADVLRTLAAARDACARSRTMVRLDACAILSDQRTVAVVSPGARVSWLCLPRLDSAALFSELVGDDSSGCFTIEPVHGGAPVRSRYAGESFTLVTQWPDLRVTDYLDVSSGRPFQKAGRTDLIRVIEGSALARVRFAPRLDFGRIPTRFRVKDEGLEIEGAHDPIVLRSPGVAWTISDHGMHQTAEAVVRPGESGIVLELRYGSANLRPAPENEATRREACARFWSGWAGSLRLPSEHPEIVKRSALVLKALCHGPTGVIAAAATTSLPEQVGGVRNWDYRFCWPRDAAMAAAALVRLGNTGHAMKFLDWMLGVVEGCESPDRIHPIYTVTGGRLPPEAELGHLGGYGQSRPVRIGNAAANQVQLDVFGPIVNVAAMLAERGAPISPEHWRLVRAMVRAVQSRWTEPDHGIWEMRMDRRHHVHSKVMCWHTVDRALVVEDSACGTRNPDWEKLREAIREDVLAHGWSPRAGAFTGAYGHQYADAATLVIGLTGLVHRSDPRWASTVAFVRDQLADGGTLRRYLIDDGLPGSEGGWHLCTGWLIESLLTLGRVTEARELFESLISHVRGPGILTEQYDPDHQLAIGNLAQAYSHMAIINAAVAIGSAGEPEAARARRADP